MAQIKVYNGTSWDTPNVKHYNGSAWVDHLTKYYSGSSWVALESTTPAPLVSARADGITNTLIEGVHFDCDAGCQFSTTGLEYEVTGTGSLTNSTTWLDQGTSDQVWVEWIKTSGSAPSWVGYANNTRYQLNVDRKFYIRDTTNSAPNMTGYFKFWDAASGGNLLQQTSSSYWEAWLQDSGCGGCCFTPETLITMADGSQRMIADIKLGDLVKTRDGVEPVEEIRVRFDRPMRMLQFENGEILRLTTDHAIETLEKGPASLDSQGFDYKGNGVPAQLMAGDHGIDIHGRPRRIAFIATILYPGKVYTLMNSTFYANGMLVY